MKALALIGGSLALLTPLPSAAQDHPALTTALRDAVAICEQAMEGDVRLPAHAELYTPITGRQGDLLDMLTTAAAPPLIQRFADTTRAGRGGSPFFIEVGSDEGGVWSIPSTDRTACDTAVTGLADPHTASAALVEAMLSSGWRLRHSEGVGDDAAPLYRYLLMRDLQGDEAGQVRAILVQGLNVGADPEGIQFEVLMMEGTER